MDVIDDIKCQYYQMGKNILTHKIGTNSNLAIHRPANAKYPKKYQPYQVFVIKKFKLTFLWNLKRRIFKFY